MTMKIAIMSMCVFLMPNIVSFKDDILAIELHAAELDWGRFPASGVTLRNLGDCHEAPMWIAYAEPLSGDWWPGKFQQGKVVLNSTCPWTSGEIDSPDGTKLLSMRDYLKVVMRHEVGHLIGLPHSDIANSIMVEGILHQAVITQEDRHNAGGLR